jgi:hypothetical protein
MDLARKDGISFGEFVRRAVQQKVNAKPVRSSHRDAFWDDRAVYTGFAPPDLAGPSRRIPLWPTLREATPEDELKAIRLFRKFADQRVSFTDCVSFTLMKRNKLTIAFTFDAHFRLAGFDILH